MTPRLYFTSSMVGEFVSGLKKRHYSNKYTTTKHVGTGINITIESKNLVVRKTKFKIEDNGSELGFRQDKRPIKCRLARTESSLVLSPRIFW